MVTRTQIEDGFNTIVQAALKDERCPTNWRPDHPAGKLPSGVTGALCDEGRIRIEVYPHNYRVIEILSGPHQGRRTKSPPYKNWRPYLVLPGNGIIRKPVEPATRDMRKATREDRLKRLARLAQQQASSHKG